MDLIHDFYLSRRPPRNKMNDLKDQLVARIERSNEVTQETIEVVQHELESYK